MNNPKTAEGLRKLLAVSFIGEVRGASRLHRGASCGLMGSASYQRRLLRRVEMQNGHTQRATVEGRITIDLSGLNAAIRKCEIENAALDLWNNGCSLDRFDRDASRVCMTATQRAFVQKVRDALEEIVDDDRREHGDN